MPINQSNLIELKNSEKAVMLENPQNPEQQLNLEFKRKHEPDTQNQNK
jgi:hypothetical protein